MFTFKKKYFVATIIVFALEVLIALFIEDKFVRPYIGDVLVVVLIYCFIMTFIKASYLAISMLVLLFSFTIEALQYSNIIGKLGLQNNKIAIAVIGTSFSWADILCYLTGILAVIIIETLYLKQRRIA